MFLLLFMDKGYDADWLRVGLAWYLDVMAVIGKRDMKKKQKDDAKQTQQEPPQEKKPKRKTPRWKVERTFSWLQRKFRRLTTRWERLPKTWNGFLNAALVYYWMNVLVR